MAGRHRPQIQVAPFGDALPTPIHFRSAAVPADATYPNHQHSWGEFVYSFHGVMELKLAGQHFLAPPDHGVWLPPDTEHTGLNRKAALHGSLYLDAALCPAMPGKACALTVSPLMRELLLKLQLNEAAQRSHDETHQRLLRVLVDELEAAPCEGSYLPGSDDPALSVVLRILQDNPGDNRTLAELAQATHSTERTLLRRCQRDLGISFAEWRQRLRVVNSLPRLNAGEKVESIALDLGYGSSSAFIAMFRRLMGVTPAEFGRGITPD
ncbi:AraC family transcriptional regulator [Granulosicoccus sp. 3-233]|uniref:AraC family transcriptional regulator n=1 Tax=Granulosicoccus sp. 3-233 TaxID=3417969 RepID=UPI003D34A4D7